MLCGLPRLPLRALPALSWLLLRLIPPSPSGAHPGLWKTVQILVMLSPSQAAHASCWCSSSAALVAVHCQHAMQQAPRSQALIMYDSTWCCSWPLHARP